MSENTVVVCNMWSVDSYFACWMLDNQVGGYSMKQPAEVRERSPELSSPRAVLCRPAARCFLGHLVVGSIPGK